MQTVKEDIDRTHHVGVFNGQARLDDETVRRIVARVQGGESQRSVARSLGVSQPTIFRIMTGETWSHVTRTIPTFARGYDPLAGQPRGEANNRAKLSRRKVLAVRRRLRAGETVAAIAARYRMSLTAIGSIKRGQTWKHVGGCGDSR